MAVTQHFCVLAAGRLGHFQFFVSPFGTAVNVPVFVTWEKLCYRIVLIVMQSLLLIFSFTMSRFVACWGNTFLPCSKIIFIYHFPRLLMALIFMLKSLVHLKLIWVRKWERNMLFQAYYQINFLLCTHLEFERVKQNWCALWLIFALSHCSLCPLSSLQPLLLLQRCNKF